MTRRNTGFSLIGWLVILALITGLLAMMMDLSRTSSKKNVGDQSIATRDTILTRALTYGQSPQAVYNSALQNPTLMSCINGTSCPSPAPAILPFTLYDSNGTTAVAGPGTAPSPSASMSPPYVYYSVNGQSQACNTPTCSGPAPLPNENWPLQAISSFMAICFPDCSRQSNISIQVFTTVFIPWGAGGTNGRGLGRLGVVTATSTPIPASVISPAPSSSPTPSPSASPSPSTSPSASPSSSPTPACMPDNGQGSVSQTFSCQAGLHYAPQKVRVPDPNCCSGTGIISLPGCDGINSNTNDYTDICTSAVSSGSSSPSPSPSSSPTPQASVCVLPAPSSPCAGSWACCGSPWTGSSWVCLNGHTMCSPGTVVSPSPTSCIGQGAGCSPAGGASCCSPYNCKYVRDPLGVTGAWYCL